MRMSSPSACLFGSSRRAGARRLPFVALSPGIRAATIMATALVVLAGGSPAEAAGAPGGRQPGLPGTARADFVPALLARGSPDVVYLLGTAWGTSPARVELLRSSDDGEHFQAVTAPPGTAPSAGAPLGDIEHLSFVSPEEGFVVRAAEEDGFLGPTSVVVTEDGGESWRQVDLPVEPRNPAWQRGTTLISPVQASGGPVYEVAITCTNGNDCPSYRLYRAEDWFAPWTPVDNPGSGSSSFNAAGSIGLSAFGDHVWLITGNGTGIVKLFGSADDGNSFRLLNANLPGIFCGLGPASSQLAWLTCDGGMMMTFYRSTDGGERFVALPVRGASTGGTAVWAAAGPLLFFMTEAGSDSGFYWSDNDGRSFEKLHALPRAFGPNGSNISDLSLGDTSGALVLTSTGTLYRTLDRGATWVRVPMPTASTGGETT